MHKKIFGKKLSRGSSARKALMRSQIRALVNHGLITTTKTKAVYTQQSVDSCVNLAKKNTLASRRRLVSFLGNDKETAKKLVKDVAPVFPKTNSGYTKVIRLPKRRGDGAQMARLEWSRDITTDKMKDTKRKKVVAKKGTRSSKAVSGVRGKLGRKKTDK